MRDWMLQLEERLTRIEAALALPPLESKQSDASALELKQSGVQPPASDVRERRAERRSERRTAEAIDAASAATRSSVVLTGVALAFFVLFGALLLRTSAQQHWLDARAATAVGLSYCIALILGPSLLSSRPRVARYAPLLAFFGGVLAPLIIVEMSRSGAVGVPIAALALMAVAVCATVAGLARASAWVVACVLLAQLGALIGLGLSTEGVAWRAGVVAVVAALSLLAAHRGRWPFLRPLILVPVAVALAGTVLVTARRPELATGVPLVVNATVLACWLCLLASCALRAKILSHFEQMSFPIATLWAGALWMFYRQEPTAYVGLAIACLLLALVGFRSIQLRVQLVLLAASAALFMVVLPELDHSGIALLAVALVVQHVSQARRIGGGVHLSSFLIVIGTSVTVARGGLLNLDGGVVPIFLGLLLAILALLHDWRCEMDRRRSSDQTAPPLSSLAQLFVLACAAVAVFLSLRIAVHRLVDHQMAEVCAQTAMWALLCLLTLAAGRFTGRTHATWLGVVGVAVLGLKVLLRDLSMLEGGYLLASVLGFGFAALVSAVMLRRPSSR